MSVVYVCINVLCVFCSVLLTICLTSTFPPRALREDKRRSHQTSICRGVGCGSRVFCIVLTMTVDIDPDHRISNMGQLDRNVRLSIYNRSILKWTNDGRFRVVIVENSGYDFSRFVTKDNEHRVEFVSVPPGTDGDLELFRTNSKGQHELRSLSYAMTQSRLIAGSDFVVKVTGRYFVPGLYETLVTMPMETQAIRQRDTGKCEVVGGTLAVCLSVFRYPCCFDMVELYYERVLDMFGHVYTLPWMSVYPTISGGSERLVRFI